MTTEALEKSYALGDAVFLTHDGLLIEGNGFLARLQDNSNMVEFRGHNGAVSHLPNDDSEVFFLKSVSVNGVHAWLLGVVCRQKDASGRMGFIGVCRLLDNDEKNLAQHAEDLCGVFKNFVEYHASILSKARHASTIGFLPPGGGKSAELKAYGEGSYVICCIEYAQIKDNDFNLLIRLARTLSNAADTVLLWPFPSKSLPVLNEIQVMMKETAHADEIAARSKEADMRRAHDPRQLAFDRRTSELRYPRPEDASVETEDYLIGLMELVIREKAKEQGSAGQEGYFTENRKESFDSVISRGAAYDLRTRGSGALSWFEQNANRLLLILGGLAVLTLIAIAVSMLLSLLLGSESGTPQTEGEASEVGGK